MEMIAFHIFVIVNTIEGCHNYTTHNESWRNVNNNMVVQPNTTSCDNKKLMTNGWHRFIGASGTRLHTQCPNSVNKCGTASPGWVIGEHPEVFGKTTNNILHFHKFYCADDFGSVEIKNCGHYKYSVLVLWLWYLYCVT